MYLDPGILFGLILGGLSRAMILFLLSSGLSLTFGVMNILNFAHATLWLLGGYITFSVFTFLGETLGENGFVLVLAIIIGTMIMVGVGFFIERFLIRRMYTRELPEQLLLTFALILIIGDLIKLVWGVEDRAVYLPVEPLEMLDTFVNPYYFIIIATGCGSMNSAIEALRLSRPLPSMLPSHATSSRLTSASPARSSDTATGAALRQSAR